MNRFSKYNLLQASNNVRLIYKAIPDRDLGYSMPKNHVFRVQIHKRFLGIAYWKTIVKTISYEIAKDAYDLMVYDDKKRILKWQRLDSLR